MKIIMGKKKKYPSAPTYKRVKAHNKTKGTKLKGFAEKHKN
ncbi:unnamed protein product [marine sediment metagenome]|uniref:Uncharacterized protein n=1 Tax=marine sediment metagenome TaxID=412755 RepID=X1RFZ4_9ZZZZ